MFPVNFLSFRSTCCCFVAGSSVTSETRFLSADEPEGEWKVILPRVNNVEYDIRHRGDHFFIEIRDEDRPNSEVLVVPVSDPTQTKVLLCKCRGTAAQFCSSMYASKAAWPAWVCTDLIHCLQLVLL